MAERFPIALSFIEASVKAFLCSLSHRRTLQDNNGFSGKKRLSLFFVSLLYFGKERTYICLCLLFTRTYQSLSIRTYSRTYDLFTAKMS